MSWIWQRIVPALQKNIYSSKAAFPTGKMQKPHFSLVVCAAPGGRHDWEYGIKKSFYKIDGVVQAGTPSTE